MMMEENQPKRMTGALISGVIYLDDQSNIQEVYWCMTADGDSAPADIQPVIRTGSLGEAHELLPTMLVELKDRFAQAAAAEMAKALRSKKSSSSTNSSKPANKPITTSLEGEDVQEADGGVTVEPEDRLDTPEQVEAEGENSMEDKGEPEEEPVSAVRIPPPVEKKTGKPAPAMASLFDGLDMS